MGKSNYVQTDHLKRAMILWLNWLFKDDQGYHFTENNLMKSLKNGRVFYEMTLRLERDDTEKTLFLPQQKEPMEKKFQNNTSLNKLFFMNSFEKLVKMKYIEEKDLEEISYKDFEKDKYDDKEKMNLDKVFAFYWKLMNVYRERKFTDTNDVSLKRDHMDDYEKFSSDLKYHIFSDSQGVCSILGNHCAETCEFDEKETKKTFLMINSSKIKGGIEYPTVFTRLGEKIDDKELEYEVKTSLEVKNTIGDHSVLVFTQANMETRDFSEIYLPERNFKKDFKISRFNDINNFYLGDVSITEITNNQKELEIPEDQFLLFHNDEEAVFVNNYRKNVNYLQMIKKWRETYPEFPLNLSFCTDQTLLSRVDELLKTHINKYPLLNEENESPKMTERERLENEVLILEDQINTLLDDHLQKEELFENIDQKDIDKKQNKEYTVVEADTPLQQDQNERFSSMKENLYLEEINRLKNQVKLTKDSYNLKKQKLLLEIDHLRYDLSKTRRNFNTFTLLLLILLNIAIFSYHYYLFFDPLI